MDLNRKPAGCSVRCAQRTAYTDDSAGARSIGKCSTHNAADDSPPGCHDRAVTHSAAKTNGDARASGG